jgi:hypothetical protein
MYRLPQSHNCVNSAMREPSCVAKYCTNCRAAHPSTHRNPLSPSFTSIFRSNQSTPSPCTRRRRPGSTNSAHRRRAPHYLLVSATESSSPRSVAASPCILAGGSLRSPDCLLSGGIPAPPTNVSSRAQRRRPATALPAVSRCIQSAAASASPMPLPHGAAALEKGKSVCG